MKSDRLLFRVDASTRMGTGHVMRCLALAQAWQDEGKQAIFVIATEASALEARLRSENIDIEHLSVIPGSVEDAKETARLAQLFETNWVVLDGYHFDAEYQRILKEAELKLLYIDDCGYANHYYADIILNQNICADENLYLNREPYTQLLLGTRYALLRREFLQWRGWKRETPSVARKVLVTLGGSDPDNVTLKVIQALQQVEIEELEAIVLVGGSNPHYEQLQATVRESPVPISLKRNASNMPELMAWADIAIAAGGSTVWELAFMGLPSAAVILADNQKAIVEKLSQLNVIINLGWYQSLVPKKIAEAMINIGLDKDTLAKLTQRGQNLVNSQGNTKIFRFLENSLIKLREVREEDCRLLWEWANDTDVRSASFESEPIPWDTHINWFAKKLQDQNCYIFIALDLQNTPIGQVRFDIGTNLKAEIDINIDPSKRGVGYGSTVIELAVRELLQKTSVYAIFAWIKQENRASIGAFKKAKFVNIGNKAFKGCYFYQYAFYKIT